jgi:hypothetical protein
MHVEVVLLFEALDLHQADVAPGADEVRDDDDGGPVGLLVEYF